MTGTPRPLGSILIAGRGLDGWAFAARLAHALGRDGPAIRIIGERPEDEADAVSLFPAIRRALADIVHPDRLVGARGSFKLGETLTGWAGDDSRAILPYGTTGADIGPVRFHQQLARLAADGRTVAPLDSYSLAAEAIRQKRFARPDRDPRQFASTLDYGLHLPARPLSDALRTAALAAGVEEIDAGLERVERSGDGSVSALIGPDGARHAADLYIDATGDAAVLSAGSGGDWEDWRGDTPFDHRVLAYRPAGEPPAPATDLQARPFGWMRILPLADRDRIELCLPGPTPPTDAALSGTGLESRTLPAPRQIRPGRRTPWSGNVLAIGTAAFRPSAVCDLDLADPVGAATRLVRLLPGQGPCRAEATEYNRLAAAETGSARDLARLVFHLQTRPEAPWTEARQRPLPDHLVHELALFRSRGRIARREHSLFDERSRTAWMIALGVRPERFDPLAAALPVDALAGRIDQIANLVRRTAASLPPHADTITLEGG